MPKARIVTSRLYVCGTAHLFTMGTANGISTHDAPFLNTLPHNVNKKNSLFSSYSDVIHSLKQAKSMPLKGL
jgi:hypothetical protein